MASVETYNIGVTPIQACILIKKKYPTILKFATGFFYRDENWEGTFLITNKHVAIDEVRSILPSHFRILIHDDERSLRSVREVEIPLYDDSMKPLWFEHPHIKDVDIIALKISDLFESGDQFQSWSKDDFPSTSQILAFGSRISIIGYPLSFYDKVHNLPIALSGSVASPYGVAFMNNPYFLIHANLHEGTSGSPVIIPRAAVRPKLSTVIHTLLGIHSGGFRMNGLELGLGVVWYPELIEDIITGNVKGTISTPLF